MRDSKLEPLVVTAKLLTPLLGELVVVSGCAGLTLCALQTTADAFGRFHSVFRRSRSLDSSYV